MKVTGGDLSDKRGCCLVASPRAVLRIEVASTDQESKLHAVNVCCVSCVCIELHLTGCIGVEK